MDICRYRAFENRDFRHSNFPLYPFINIFDYFLIDASKILLNTIPNLIEYASIYTFRVHIPNAFVVCIQSRILDALSRQLTTIYRELQHRFRFERYETFSISDTFYTKI